MKRIVLTYLFIFLIAPVFSQKQFPHPEGLSLEKGPPDTSKPSPTKIYNSSQIDQHPQFPRGGKAYNEFLSKNLRWPSQIDAEGRVIVSFVVEKDGTLTNFKIEKGFRKEFDEEAIRVLKKSPKWTPARKNNIPVRVRYIVPVTFALNE
jgi:protein TonB